MSKMSELDLCISDIAGHDKELRKRLVDEIELHLNNLLPYDQMSEDAQKVICLFEQENKAEQSYHQGHLSMPDDDE